jgi:uncharacterized OB-fold protein
VTAPIPVPDTDSAGFWESARAGTLAIARCAECHTWHHPPLERCRRCGGAMAFEPVSGDGRVFSFIVVRHLAVPGHEIPYVVAFVELPEQPGLRMTAIVDAEPDTVAIGMPVRVRMVGVGADGMQAPEFVPVRRTGTEPA